MRYDMMGGGERFQESDKGKNARGVEYPHSRRSGDLLCRPQSKVEG
jgi:hypothetical protein